MLLLSGIKEGFFCRCQIQAVLRLELCRLFSTQQSDSVDPEQLAEEVRFSLLNMCFINTLYLL